MLLRAPGDPSFIDRPWDALGPDVAPIGDEGTNGKKDVKGAHQDLGACLHEQCRAV